jgi:hypothetical protein
VGFVVEHFYKNSETAALLCPSIFHNYVTSVCRVMMVGNIH